MLILTRKIGESIVIGDDIEIVLAELTKGAARIGINAPKKMSIYRKEIYEKILKENKKASKSVIDDSILHKLNTILTNNIGGKSENNN